MISELKSLSWSIDRIRESDDLEKDEIEECLGQILEILLKMNKAKIVVYPYDHGYDIVSEGEIISNF